MVMTTTCPLPPVLRELLQTIAQKGTDRTAPLAAATHYTPATICSYFKTIHQLLGTHTRLEAFHTALRLGWVTMEAANPPPRVSAEKDAKPTKISPL